MQYRRTYIPGGTYFFTVVTYHRRPLFISAETIDTLRDAFKYTLIKMPFTIVASVILPDHLHFIWTLPEDDSDYSTRWRLIKSHFTHHWQGKGTTSTNASRHEKGEADVWQRRFWEHLIRDETDLTRHIEYIHYNPVKHGLARTPVEWKYSSFTKYVRDGVYPADWGGDGKVWEGERWME
jgi:putative transposase